MKKAVGLLSTFASSLAIALRGVDAYAPFTEGWWHVYVRWLNDGMIPYRDFELLVPPGYPLILRSVTGIFGEDFYTLRLLGGVQIALLGACIFLLVSHFAGQALAVVFSAAAIAHLVTGTAYVSYDYVYTALLLMLVSFTLVLSLLIGESESPGVRWRMWVVAGVFVGAALSVKQTQGFWTVFGVFILVAIYKWRDVVELLHRLTLILMGVGVVWIPMSIWLFIEGVTPMDLFQSLYLSGGPKGSVSEIFFGWARDIFNLGEVWLVRPVVAHWLVLFQAALPFLLVAGITRVLTRDTKHDRFLEGVSLTGVFAVGLILWSIRPSTFGSLTSVLEFLWELVSDNRLIAWFVLPFFLMWLFVADANRKDLGRACALVVCSIAVVWACGMSAGVTEIGDFLSIAVAMSFFVYLGSRKWITVVIAGFMALSIATGSWWKKAEIAPYAWWAYETPSSVDVTARYEQGLMEGLRTTPEIKDLFDQFLSLRSSFSDCPGEVVAFPHIPLFILEVGSTPGGRLGQYWYDFSSVDEVKRESQRLRGVEIKAVITMHLPAYVRETHQQLFSEGRVLPHLELENVIRQRSKELQTIATSQISAEASLTISVSECVAHAETRTTS